jgi:aspartate aminotransferase-like enzyme
MAMYSVFQPGEKVLVVDNGKFSGRWAAYAPLLGLETAVLSLTWGEVPEPEAVVAVGKGCAGLVLTHSETSTGALLDLEEIAFAWRRAYPEALIVVDAITSAGAVPLYFDDWDLDVAVAASQKALLNPAGLVAFALSERAQARLRPTHSGDFRNWYHYLQSHQTGDYPFTPPVQLLFGVDAVLARLQEETLPVVWNRVHHAAQAFRAPLARLGGELLAESPTDSLTAFSLPGVDHRALQARLEAAGYVLAGGQGPFKGKLLRVSHMGEVDAALMEKLAGAMAAALA